MDLDHAALALHDVTDALDAFTGTLGASVLDGGQAVGFRIVQVRVGAGGRAGSNGEGMTVELMEPWAADRFDFLARFLARNGEGPHHLTFKVEGIEDEIARLETAGYSPVRTQLTNPWWREAFYHPKDTFGTVIQVAEATFRPDLVDGGEGDGEREGEGEGEGEFGSIEWWPEPAPRADARSVLRRVVLGVPELDPAARFFGEVLEGSTVERADEAVEFAWPGGGRVRLEHRPGVPPGVDRYECEREGAPLDLTIGGVRVVVRSE